MANKDGKPNATTSPKTQAVVDMVFKLLDTNPNGVPFAELKQKAERLGADGVALQRAKIMLGVKTTRGGPAGGVWSLPLLRGEKGRH